MTDKEAIDNLKNYIECLMEDYGYYKDIVEFRDSVEHLEKSLQTQQAEIEKKDKIIDLMIKVMIDSGICDYFIKQNCKHYAGENKKLCDVCIKEYFERKVENGN